MYGLADEIQDLQAKVKSLEEERLRFYRADGTFEVLASPEEVTKRRVECAKRIERLEAEAVIRKQDFDKITADRNIHRTFVGNLAAEIGGDTHDLSALYSLVKAKLGIRRP